MSLITDASIQVNYATEKVHEALVLPFEFDSRHQRFVLLNTDSAGGVKVFTAHLYAGSFNYVGAHELADWFLALPWKDGDSAVLTAEGENYDLTVVVVSQGKRMRIDNECVNAWRDEYRLVAEAVDV